MTEEASPNNAMRGIGAYNSGGVYGLAFWASLGDAATVSNTRMFIDANTGNVGIGTTSPWSLLHIKGADAEEFIESSSGGDGAELRLYNSGGGATTETWSMKSRKGDASFAIYAGADIAGNERLRISNTGNVGIGTTSPEAKLEVVYAAGAPLPKGLVYLDNWGVNALTTLTLGDSGYTNARYLLKAVADTDADVGGPYDIFAIRSDGNVGIGTVSPTGHLTVRGSNGDGNGFLRLEDRAGSQRSIYLAGGSQLNFNNGIDVGYLSSNSQWVSNSDKAHKKDIVEMSKYGLDTVMLMKPRQYRMKADGLPQIGFISQEMQELIPEVVFGEKGQLGIAYGNLAAVLTRAIQEQQRQIEEQGKGAVLFS